MKSPKKNDVLTKFIETLGSFGDLSTAPLKLSLQSLAQVQDTNDPPEQVTSHLQLKAKIIINQVALCHFEA